MRFATALSFATLLTTSAHSADDPNIPKEEKAAVQKAMQAHIDSNRVGEKYVIYDGVAGELLRLGFVELHAGVVRKGEFYVSCADFTSADGTMIDVDFLVAGEEDDLRVLDAIVHKVAGTKRPYRVEDKPSEPKD